MGRHKFAVLSLTAVSLASSFWFLLDVLGRHPSCTLLWRAEFENRFTDFPKPDPDTVYGYVSDNRPNDPSALAEFHLTQYTLAPAIIKPSANEHLVIVNYHAKIGIKLLRANHLDPYQDFGNGIALCRGPDDDAAFSGRDLAGRIRLGSLDVSAAAPLVAA